MYSEIENIFIHLINSSLETGLIPDKLKISTIISIRKINKTKRAEEFRPINILPTETKILEKVVYRQLMDYIIENNILCRYQLGFQQNYNCETPFQHVIRQWKDNTDNDNYTMVLFLDLKRAYETIDREKLIKKLSNLGIAGTVSKWMKNYLKNIQQHVKHEQNTSQNKDISVGIPQGSILGSLLFILYINDIGRAIKHCNLFVQT